MAKYTSDANLITGAAVAYKNWDNVKGTYDGLDKITSKVSEISENALAERKDEAKLLKAEEKAAKEKSQKQVNAFYEMSKSIHEQAGSFKDSTGRYAEVAADLEELQPRYIDVMENGTATEKAAVQAEYNNIKFAVESEVQFRADVAHEDHGISIAAMKSSDHLNGDGGNDGRDFLFITEYLEKETKSDEGLNEQGKRTYTIDVNGTPMTKTYAEIEAMTVMSDAIPFANFDELRGKEGSRKGWFDRGGVESKVRNEVLPSGFNERRAFVNDPSFNGESFLDLLNKEPVKNSETGIAPRSNKDRIKEEMLLEIYNNDSGHSIFDDGDGEISETEWVNFTQAIVDPYHKTWKKEDGKHDEELWIEMSGNIMVEQLTNGIENLHRSKNPPKRDATGGKSSGSGGSKTGLEYIKNSKLKSESINKLVTGKITLQGIREIAIDLGPKVSYSELKDGTIQILDSQKYPYIIDPKKPIEARTKLYNLSQVREEHRSKQVMGVALDSDDASQRGYTTFDPTK